MGELLFAISGNTLEYTSADPFKREIGQQQRKHPVVEISATRPMEQQGEGVVIPIDTNRGTIVPRGVEFKAMAA
jgi:hypothetical protein